jgi:uncharacterized protein (DUF58 family)
VALLLIAFLFDAAPLFVPAVALLVIGVSAAGWVWTSAAGASAQRHLQTERVVEDHPLEATIEVRRGGLGLPGAEVVDPFTGSQLDLSGPLSPFRGGRVARVRVVTRFPRRGLHTLAPPTLLVRDPLELARVEATSAAPPQQLLVLPRTEPVRWLQVAQGRRFEMPDGRNPAEAFAAVDVDGLRPYRPGAPASRIHWPAVARGAGLIERRLLPDGDSRPLIVLDARGDGPHELLDAAVRAAASLTLELARSGGCGLLLPGEQRITTIDREFIAWPAAYARLAVVRAERDGPGSRGPAAAVLSGRTGPLIYIAAGVPDRLAALTADGRGLVVLVVPTATLEGARPPGVRGSLLPTLDVSGCRGFLVGRGRERERVKAREMSAA